MSKPDFETWADRPPGRYGNTRGWFAAFPMATIPEAIAAIDADPLSFLDCLFMDNIVERRQLADGQAAYMAPPIHEHDWHVATYGRDTYVPTDNLILRCSCGEIRTVPNRLPIEIPE